MTEPTDLIEVARRIWASQCEGDTSGVLSGALDGAAPMKLVLAAIMETTEAAADEISTLRDQLAEATEHLGLVLGSDPGPREIACRQAALKWWLAFDAEQERSILSRPQQGGDEK